MIATWMLYVVVVSAVVGLAAALTERAAAATGRPLRWIWVAAFVLAAIVVAAPGPSLSSIWASAQVGHATEVAIEGPSATMETVAASDAGGQGILSERLDFWLLVLWAGLAALLLARWLRDAARTRQALRVWVPLDLPEGRVLVSRTTGPAVVGALGARVVLPRWCLDLPAAERRLVMAHETEHQRARDGLLTTCGLLLACLVPWNLPFWAYLARLRDAVEMDCDRRVMARHPDARRTYGELLLTVATRAPGPGLALATRSRRPSTLSRRIAMLTSDTRGSSPVRTLLLAGAGLLVVAAACLVPGPDRDEATVTDPDEHPILEQSALAEQPTFTPYTVAPEVRNRAEVVRALEQEYPAMLRDAGIGGTVLAHLFIDEEGAVRNVAIAESSGHASLDEAALAVADRMVFTPALNQDERVPVWIQIPLIFQTRGDDPLVRETRAGVEAREIPHDLPPPHRDQAGLEEAPAFTPYTVAPEVRNRAEVQRSLARAYPEQLRDAGVGGATIVHFFIDERGTVQNTMVAESSGHSALDAAALEVASSFQFSPALNREQRVPVWVQIPIIFQAR